MVTLDEHSLIFYKKENFLLDYYVFKLTILYIFSVLHHPPPDERGLPVPFTISPILSNVNYFLQISFNNRQNITTNETIHKYAVKTPNIKENPTNFIIEPLKGKLPER